jgi:DNA gyrase subunit A
LAKNSNDNMAKKKTNEDEIVHDDSYGSDSDEVSEKMLGVIPRNIVDEMKDSYLDYAMSVIASRALPDIRDGLKPVHRRILYSMHQNGLVPTASFKKSATVVGDVLGNYHPHGDSSVYEAMVKLVQDFTTRYPLVKGQGNFGSIDGDGAAAYRYTEAKMDKIALEMLRDIEKDTVNFQPNYDGKKKEPTVLPTRVPNLLLNGTLGIAVGMATNIPPHNLGEVIDATMHLIENDNATTEDLLEYVKGPDFPTGGIAYNREDIKHAYATGRGGVVTRGHAEIVETKADQYQIVITSIPFRVNKATMQEAIAGLVQEKKLEGIKAMRDESTKDIRVVIELKNGAQPQKILNYLFKHTELEKTFHYNMVALVDGVPQTLSLREMLEEFIKHRQVVVRRRSEFELKKAKDREHILIGLKKALDHIDEVIKLIRASKDVEAAKKGLMDKFKFSELQAIAILEMRLQRLANLERQKIEDELKEVQKLIAYLEDLLSSERKILKVVKGELEEVKANFADKRRTQIVAAKLGEMSDEDLIPDEESVLVYTKGGYVKRTDPDEYRMQKRGGVGSMDVDVKEEDFVSMLISTSTHSDLLFFSDRGKAYQIKMHEIPEGKRATRGKSIANFIQLADGERITSILPMPKDIRKAAAEKYNLYMITKRGYAKRAALNSFTDVRRSGIIAIGLDAGDELLEALFVEKGDSVILASREGQSIRFDQDQIRVMGRTAGGVTAMRLDKGETIISADVVKAGVKNAELLIMTANGYGKKTPIEEYKIQNRGGSGIKTVKVTDKTGELIVAKIVTPEVEQIIAMSRKSQVIKIDANTVPSLGRDTQGVRIMKPRDGDSLASLTLL